MKIREKNMVRGRDGSDGERWREMKREGEMESDGER